MLWYKQKDLLYHEVIQRREEGCDVTGYAERVAALDAKDLDGIDALYAELDALPVAGSFPYDEPDALEEICAASDAGKPDATVRFDEDDLYDRLYGAWLGRCAGCALGKPFECYPYIGGKDGLPGYAFIRRWMEGAGEYPPVSYVPGVSRASEEGLGVPFKDSQREHIRFMETDDDVRYTVLGLILGEEKGNDFTPEDVGILWHRFLPVRMTFTAEACAYINALNAEQEDPDARREYIRRHHNPFREWIGAQIRIDHYAYANAGRPHEAARVAFRDATFSHTKNGVYGAMFCAGMIAQAFCGTSPEDCVEAGLSVIPKCSRLYAAVRKAVDIAKTATSLENLYERLWEAFGSYHPVHTINNAACCAASLIYGNGDFGKSIVTAVCCGWDTDCNGATVGSVLGALLGAKGLPASWTEPLHDTLYSAIPDFHPVAISACAKRSLAVFEKLHTLEG